MPIPHLSLSFPEFRPRAAALALTAGVVALTGCDRDQVSHATPVQTAPAANAAPAAMPPAGMPPAGMPPGGMGGGGQLPPPPKPAGHGAMKWTAPKGWTETAGTGMRFATLTAPGPGSPDLSVIVLPGPAGGEPANVNRWRGQLSLPAMDDNALLALKKTVKSKAGLVSVYDFSNQGKRMVAGLLSTSDGNTWFLKLTGDADPVGKAKPDFMRFLETLHLD
jgi:hypothetical protein